MAQYIDIIFFGVLAVFLFFKLKNVLGETEDDITGNNNNRTMASENSRPQNAGQTSGSVIRHITTSSSVSDALKSLVAREPSFNPLEFLDSAKSAFEMIVKAFVIGDRNTLRMLLSPELFAKFEKDIINREEKGEILHISINDYKKIVISDVDVRENFVKIEVTYNVEEIVFTRDLNGKILDGNETDVDITTDIWTFEKELNSSNPTWLLVETRTDNDEKY